MNNELISHVRDLAERSYKQNIYTFTDFLTLAEQSDVFGIQKEFGHVGMTLFGGFEECERKMLRFGKEDLFGYEEEFPISIVAAEPLSKKFAEPLTHRDFLGALMSLGMSREVLGDIVVKENTGYIFCEERMAGYIRENLIQIKHTNVGCTIAKECPLMARPDFQSLEFVVSSERCDAVVAKAYNLSRNQSSELFSGNCIFIDGKQCESTSYLLKPGNTVSVRGQGKFIFDGINAETKKGRFRASIRKYI